MEFSKLKPSFSRNISRRIYELGEQIGEINEFLQPDILVVNKTDLSTDPQSSPDLAKIDEDAAVTKSNMEKLGRRIMEPQKVPFRDCVLFTLGVTNVALTAYIIGRWPHSYYHYWALKSVILFTLRYFSYKKKGLHYMMFELCYAAGFLGMAHAYFYQQSPVVRKAAFSMMAGPLQWSILAMRNSLVFHDFDKITTLMMHSSPALVAFIIRWYPNPNWTAGFTAQQMAEYDRAGFKDLVITPMLFYMVWLVCYYILIFVLLAKRIARKGYKNMFTEMILSPKARKSSLAKLVMKAPTGLQPLVYLMMHGVAAALAVLTTPLCWHYFYFHTATLLFVLFLSAWNGANFYFKVFAIKYLKELEEREEAKKKERVFLTKNE
jgi:hypothetical protein